MDAAAAVRRHRPAFAATDDDPAARAIAAFICHPLKVTQAGNTATSASCCRLYRYSRRCCCCRPTPPSAIAAVDDDNPTSACLHRCTVRYCAAVDDDNPTSTTVPVDAAAAVHRHHSTLLLLTMIPPKLLCPRHHCYLRFRF